jgi:translation initiation factor 2 alpha subunit (eIF-2alpha)
MGTGMSQSSGVFTFPSTGFYLILWEAKFRLVDGDVAETFIEITTNNSSYSEVAIAASVNNTGSDTDGYNATAHYIVDVTDTSNVKVRFKTGSMANNSYVIGQSGYNQTSATFIRLGDKYIKIIKEGATMPTEAEVNAKIQELKDIETAHTNARTTGKAKLKTGETLTDAEVEALFG